MLSPNSSSRAVGLSSTARRLQRSGRLLAPSAVAVARSRHRLQYRSFWFGAWSKYCDDDACHDVSRRHRVRRYRYMESLHRRHCWENKPRHDSVQAAMKTAFAHIAHGPAAKAASRYINVNDIKSWSDEFSGVRPGRNIEDVEREAIDHLFSSGRRGRSHLSEPWTTSLNNIRNYLHGRRRPKQVTPEDVLNATTSARDKNTTTPGSQEPFSPTQDELKKYTPNNFDDPVAPQKPTPEETSKKYSDLDKYKPVEWNEPDGLPTRTPEEESKIYKDLHKYGSSGVNSDAAPAELTPKQPYDDLQKYKPVEWNEPDGFREKTAEELSKEYDDLHKYGSVSWNEPNGLRESTPEELSKQYDDLDQYGPVTWNEPNGLRKATPEEESKIYDDLDAYSKPFVVADSVLAAHELTQMDSTPKADPVPAKVESFIVENPAQQYKDLHKYGPVKWNEPDGLRKPTPEELSKNYTDLHLYAQYPNGGPATPRIHPEEASKQYSDLRKYDAFANAGPITERVHPELASKQYQDLSQYPSAGYEEPDIVAHIHPEELTKNYEDLERYSPRSFESPDKAYSNPPEKANKSLEDLHRYQPVMHNEPDGKLAERADSVASGLQAYDSINQTEAEPRTADEIRSDVLRRAYRNSKFTTLQRATLQREQQLDGRLRGKPDSLGGLRSKGKASLDSAVEIDTSSSRVPTKRATTSSHVGSLGSDRNEAEFCSMDESFPSKPSRLQTALDRKATKQVSAMSRLEKIKLEEDPYSASPQGLETNYTEECGGKATWPAFVKHHEGITQEEPAAKTVAEDEPAMYKMLAYDPCTQSVVVAEATSGAQATSTATTPAEVLLRISNPSKFFPHFSALQAEGYEMVSGGGDVLVFRKARQGSGTSTEAPSASASSTINPIDMMGRSAASTFASPTGYVNYETPQYRPTAYAQGSEVRVGKKKRSLGRRVVIGTAWLAGTAYAVSVVGEYFSTGGKVF